MAPTPEEMAELEEMLRDGARYAELDDVEAALASGTNVDAADEQGRTGAWVRARRVDGSAWLHGRIRAAARA